MRNPLRSVKAPATPAAAKLPIPPALAAAIEAVNAALASRARVLKLKSDLAEDLAHAKTIQDGAAARLNALSLDIALAEESAVDGLKQQLKAARAEAAEAEQTIANFDRLSAAVEPRLAEADAKITAAADAFEPELAAFRGEVRAYLEWQLIAAAEQLGEVMKRIFATEPSVVLVGWNFTEELRVPSLSDHRSPLLWNGALRTADGAAVKLAEAWPEDPALVAWRGEHRAIGPVASGIAEHRSRIAREATDAWIRANNEARARPPRSQNGNMHPNGRPPSAAPAPPPPPRFEPHSYTPRTPGTPAPRSSPARNEIGITGPHRIAPETGEHG